MSENPYKPASEIHDEGTETEDSRAKTLTWLAVVLWLAGLAALSIGEFEAGLITVFGGVLSFAGGRSLADD